LIFGAIFANLPVHLGAMRDHMIIFGIKPVSLKTTALAYPCADCNHDYQRLHVYRIFFTLFFLPVLPLSKKTTISCPHCGRETRKAQFLKQLPASQTTLAHDIQKAIQEARTPFSAYRGTILLLGLFAIGFVVARHEERQALQATFKYIQEPVENVLLVCKATHEAYPYHITYIQKIVGVECVMLEWNYQYKTAYKAINVLSDVRKVLSENAVEHNFQQPFLISKNDLSELSIIRVEPLS
jgi:hypothetical protein